MEGLSIRCTGSRQKTVCYLCAALLGLLAGALAHPPRLQASLGRPSADNVGGSPHPFPAGNPLDSPPARKRGRRCGHFVIRGARVNVRVVRGSVRCRRAKGVLHRLLTGKGHHHPGSTTIEGYTRIGKWKCFTGPDSGACIRHGKSYKSARDYIVGVFPPPQAAARDDALADSAARLEQPPATPAGTTASRMIRRCGHFRISGYRFNVRIERGRVSCARARRVLHKLYRGKGHHHSGPTSAESYTTIGKWRCGTGAGGGACIRHGRTYKDARDYIVAEVPPPSAPRPSTARDPRNWGGQFKVRGHFTHFYSDRGRVRFNNEQRSRLRGSYHADESRRDAYECGPSTGIFFYAKVRNVSCRRARKVATSALRKDGTRSHIKVKRWRCKVKYGSGASSVRCHRRNASFLLLGNF